MPLPEKEYFDLPTLAKRWNAALEDVQHYAETGRLRCSMWIDQTWIEIGTFHKQANGGKEFVSQESVYVEGFVGIVPEDCRKLFRNKHTCTTVFASLKMPGCYLNVTGERRGKIVIKPKDIVVRINDRDSFEKQNHLRMEGYSMALQHYAVLCEPAGPDFVHPPKQSFSHSGDYHTVTIADQVFTLGIMQAKIIRMLHAASKTGNPWVLGKQLLFDAGSKSERIKNIFQRQPEWRILIASDGKGYYRLNI